jgi:hypothetical protein
VPDALFDVANAYMNNISAQFVSGSENRLELNGFVNIHSGTFLKSSNEVTIEIFEVLQPSRFLNLDCLKKVGSIYSNLNFMVNACFSQKFLFMHRFNGLISTHKLD